MTSFFPWQNINIIMHTFSYTINVREVVEQGQYIFDTLWNKAIPAEQRIREIEEGLSPILNARQIGNILYLVLEYKCKLDPHLSIL
jgi:hypothetical protein